MDVRRQILELLALVDARLLFLDGGSVKTLTLVRLSVKTPGPAGLRLAALPLLGLAHFAPPMC
jgi:hypothetical protein